MNRLIFWMQNVRIRIIATALVVGLTLLINIALGYGNPFKAKGENLLTNKKFNQITHVTKKMPLDNPINN